jgi:hypothetical protein
MKCPCKFQVVITAVMLSCSDNAPPTPERNFYFEIGAYQKNKFSSELAALLKNKIPQQKYAITNRSGMVWPYYQAMELNETISTDSLMPPHWYVHKMIFKDSNSIIEKEDHLVRIDLMPHLDTIPNYRVEIYEMDSIGLTFSASSGIHFVDSTKLPSGLSFNEYCLKSIIRYSFK